MTHFDLTDPVNQILLAQVVLFVLCAWALVFTYQNIKRLDEQHQAYTEENAKAHTILGQDLSMLRANTVSHDKWLKDTDTTIGIIRAELFKPLYEVGNIVDFTHKDYDKPLSGKITKVNTFSGHYPDYTVEVEKGITYNIHQSQIVAWTN